jgi:hypothetical protein
VSNGAPLIVRLPGLTKHCFVIEQSMPRRGPRKPSFRRTPASRKKSLSKRMWRIETQTVQDKVRRTEIDVEDGRTNRSVQGTPDKTDPTPRR